MVTRILLLKFGRFWLIGGSDHTPGPILHILRGVRWHFLDIFWKHAATLTSHDLTPKVGRRTETSGGTLTRSHMFTLFTLSESVVEV